MAPTGDGGGWKEQTGSLRLEAKSPYLQKGGLLIEAPYPQNGDVEPGLET